MTGRTEFRRRRVVGCLAVIGASAVATYGHLGYPVALYVKTRKLAVPKPPQSSTPPGLTVVIPAYREEAVIADKISELRTLGYPGFMDVLVVADDAETAAAAARAGAQVLTSPRRSGKAVAVNRGVAAAKHPIVVLTDANTSIHPDALTAVARHFADPTVGAVSGEKRVEDASGQGLYWQFDSWLKHREMRTGTCVALVGELLAVRREYFQALPPDTAVDDTWLAIDMARAGHRLVFEPEARAYERSAADIRTEWERRTRIVSGNIDALWRNRAALFRWGDAVAFQLWGHRLIRSSLGPFAHALALLVAVGQARRSRLARATVAGHVAAAAITLHVFRGTRPPRLARVVAQVMFLQAVGLGGSIRYLRRDSVAIWPKGDRISGFGPVTAHVPAPERTATGTRGAPDASRA